MQHKERWRRAAAAVMTAAGQAPLTADERELLELLLRWHINHASNNRTALLAEILLRKLGLGGGG